jgi:hypothetical protein
MKVQFFSQKHDTSSVVGGFSDKDSTLTVVASTPWTNITFFLAIPLMKNE